MSWSPVLYLPHRRARSRTAPTRHLAVAVAVCLSAWLGLLPAHAGMAQERSPSPTPKKLWKAYPLAPTAAPSAQPNASSSPAASAGADRRPGGTARARSDGGAPASVLVLLALLTAGGAVSFAGIRRRRRRRDGEPDVAAPSQALSGVTRPAVKAPPRYSSGRFSRVPGQMNRSQATAPVASALWVAGGGPRAGGEPAAPAAAAVPPAGDPSPVADAPEGSPPDRRLAWTAEIEWRHSDGESRFCVIARGPGTVTLTRSAPLEWPPTGPAAVQAMTDAAERLAATLAAAGWKTLPPGHSWYGKRFAWEPGAQPAQASPVKSKSGTVARVRPAGQAKAPSGGKGALHRRRPRLALLCVLVALGAVAALQLRRGDDDRQAASPATRATATPAHKPRASAGVDLTTPVLVLLGIVSVVLVIRETRRDGRG